jgi:HSP20 family protein
MANFLSLLPVNFERRFSMLPSLRNGSLIPTVSGGPVNRLASLFDHFFNDEPFVPTLSQRTALPLSVWEDEQTVYAEADLPGVTEKDIEVSVDCDQLIIRGERKCERKEGRWDSRSYGRFEQRMSLPAPVDAEKAEAKLDNGVLSLSLPKIEAARPRRISIKSK